MSFLKILEHVRLLAEYKRAHVMCVQKSPDAPLALGQNVACDTLPLLMVCVLGVLQR